MHTVTIIIERPGSVTGNNLSKDTEYLISYAENPPGTLKIDCDQVTFNQKKQLLEYTGVSNQDRLTAVDFFGKLMADVLNRITPPIVSEINKNPNDVFHLRLLMNAKELVQLPFELALNPQGVQGQPLVPFIMNQLRVITMTRSLRQYGPVNYEWPIETRILFVYASPNETVPHSKHFEALRDVVKELVNPDQSVPTPVADIPSMITILPKASLQSIGEKIKEGINGRPYTHIHILAHGSKENDSTSPEEYRVSLHDNDDPSKPFYASGIELADAIIKIDGNTAALPAIVSLMVCDSSNTGDVSLPAGSVAHQLHEAGIPCVFASQFKLSVEGSVKLVSSLYKQLLLKGDDPRRTLYFVRRDLFSRDNHDWASLVVHARFPNDIDEQMKAYRLNVILKALETSSAWVEHLLAHISDIPPAAFLEHFDNITERLENTIKYLDTLFKVGKVAEVGEKYYAEQSGLIASAYKREAQHFFRLAEFKKEIGPSLLQKSKEALISARNWYFTGFDSVRRNHWTGIQYLSLTAVTKNSFNVDERKHMTVVEVMASDAAKQAEDPEARIWGWGALMEFNLLQPLLAPVEKLNEEAETALKAAKEYVRNIARADATFISDNRIKKDKIVFAKKSTSRQLSRYVNWWPVLFPSPQMSKLKEMAGELLAELNQ